MAKLDLRNHRPSVEMLPDGRQRATFTYDVREWVGRTLADIAAECWADWGAAAPGDFSALRLVKQELKGLEPDKTGAIPLVRIYEELHATDETQVGEDSIAYGEDGGKTIVAQFIQFASSPATPGTINTTTAPNDATLYLNSEDSESDGTLRRIKRTYVQAGQVSTSEEVKNNGALTLRTITSVRSIPATPSGFTLVSSSVKNPDGVPTYSYTFAKGTGTISTSDDKKHNGALLTRTTRYLTVPGASNPIATPPSGYTLTAADFSDQDGYRIWTVSYAQGSGEISRTIDYSQSVNQGTAGITRTTIRYLVAPSATVQPTTLSGSVEVGREFSEADGHRIWTTTWAKGTGEISTSDDTKNNGMLHIRTIRSLGTAPSTPSGYVLTGTASTIEAGYTVYSYSFAAGDGEISRSTDYINSIDAGATGGITRVSIRYLTDPSTDMRPASLSGYVLASKEVQEVDGHRIWSTTWAKGTGTASESKTIHNGGKLVIYGKLGLDSAPSAPSATIGGTVTLISQDQRKESGYLVYDYRWAEGEGTISTTRRDAGRGLYEEVRTALGTYAIPPGVVIAFTTELVDGVTRYTATCLQDKTGAYDPTSGYAEQYTTKRPFTYPGRAKVISTNSTAAGFTKTCYDVFRSPPITVLIDATVTVTYQTSSSIGALSYTLWNPDTWATIYAKYWGWNGYPKSPVVTLLGYRSVDSTPTYFNGGSTTGYLESCMEERVFGIGDGWPYSLQVTGGPAAPDGNTYTLSAELEPAFINSSGTQYYRKTIVTATIPTQTALPV